MQNDKQITENCTQIDPIGLPSREIQEISLMQEVALGLGGISAVS